MSDLQKKINQIVADYMAASRYTEYSAKRLTREGAQIYVQQHGVFTRHSRQCWAFVVGQCPEVEVRRFIEKENLYEEEGIEELSHYLKLVAMGEALGLTKDQVNNADALPSTRAALHIWENLTKNRHWMIGCAAKGCLEQINQPECGTYSYNQGHSWMKHTGIPREAVEFWLMHDELDRVHGSGSFDFVTKYLKTTREVTELQILAACEESMFAWKTFLDGIADAAEAKPRTRAAA